MSKKSASTWADVVKGDVVDLGGRGWSVVKIKPKGKKAHVEVRFGKREAASAVRLADRVTIIERRGAASVAKSPVMDKRGTQQRWATPRELDAALGRGLPAGNGSPVKPPKKAKGDGWDAKNDAVEKRLADRLTARLVGEATDEKVGYYVPPVDVTTVASHLALFHGGIPAACEDEGRMLSAHDAQHAEAAKGAARLAVNHWHTEARP